MHLRVMSVSQLGGGGGVSANLNLYGYFSCACHRLLTLVILLLNEPNDVALPSLKFMFLLSCRTYCPNRSDSSSQRPDVMIKLRLGLMKLLEMKLFNLPTEHVPAVIGEVLKAEYMLVWAYHDSDDVRVFAIKV